MPDHLVVCWVAATPSTCIWRHPCIVLAAQLLLRHLVHLAYLLRTKLPRMLGHALVRGARHLNSACPIRRIICLCHCGSGDCDCGDSTWKANYRAGIGFGLGYGGGFSGFSGFGGSGWAAAGGGGANAAAAAGPSGSGSCGGASSSWVSGTPVEMPLEILQRLGPWLSALDTGAARLVCRTWRDCLGSQVATAILPPALWQFPARGQLAQLRRLTAAFPLLRTVHCAYDRGAPLEGRTMRRTMGLLARTTPTVCALRLHGMVDAGNWPALVEGLSPIAPQLTSLDLGDLCWPDAVSTVALAGGSTGLRRLRMRSAVFSRLVARHVEAVAGLERLRELSLGFRTVEGTTSSPLPLDPITRLSQLASLDLEYTGLLELSSGVGFRRPDRLSALTALTSLSVRLVPLPDISALARLPMLRALRLVQVAAVTAKQADALARCAALTRLELEPLPWELLPSLGALPRLRALSVHLLQVPRGGPPPRAADALLSLAPLSALTSFALAGQLKLEEGHIIALAEAWPRLRALDLCCGLTSGTSGFSALTALRRLRLSPYRWDVWSHEVPLLLHPAELPVGLTCLEARDVWVAAPGPDAARLGASSRRTDFSWSVGVCPATRHTNSSASSASGSGASGSYAGGRGSGSGSSGVSGSGRYFFYTGLEEEEEMEEVKGEDVEDDGTSSLVAVVTGTYWLVPPQSPPFPPRPAPISPAARAAALTLSTPSLRRLVLRCVGGAHCDASLPLPGLSRLTALEELDLHHSQTTAADLESITTSAAAGTLRALRLVLVDDSVAALGSALTKLTRLTGLEALCIHANERALNRRVRTAIASMDCLRRLTLVTSPDFPSHFASGLLVLTRLRHLAVLRIGLGFGAMDALRRLQSCVARALPRCRFEMLPDADSLLLEEADADAKDARSSGYSSGYGGQWGFLNGKDAEGEEEEEGADGGAARARGPRYVRLMRSSWAG